MEHLKDNTFAKILERKMSLPNFSGSSSYPSTDQELHADLRDALHSESLLDEARRIRGRRVYGIHS